MKTYIKSKVLLTGLLLFVVTAIVGITLSVWTSRVTKAEPQNRAATDRLVVHEWGTFTSIAGKNGIALDWRPLNGSSDLPKFVYTISDKDRRPREVPLKSQLRALVRMETPILYFYSGSEMEVDVRVDFPNGKITEWYPQARSTGAAIDWGRITIMPGAALNLPVDSTDSHYYPARETDAAPVQVRGTEGQPTQQEKFLFYRGVASFDLPLSVRLEQGRVLLQNRAKNEITNLVVFENRGGKIGYRLINAFTGQRSIERPALNGDLESLVVELKQVLVASGLYLKEAEAMIKTWRKSWFEEGMRVFYILPRQITDAVLPLTIEPRANELVRVLVGRTEVITPEMEKQVQSQVSLLGDPSPQVRETALQNIRKYGRFSEPILMGILENEKDAVIRQRIQELIAKVGEKAG